MLLCPADYIYNPITPYRQEIFRRLMSEINGGDVLDLGCDHVGHYWALGYVQRVSSYSLYDYNEDSIKKQQMAIENLSGAELEAYFSETIDFLKEENFVSKNTSNNALAESMICKFSDCRNFDYLKPKITETFDSVLAVESLEIVHKREDFLKGLETVKNLLNPGGQLLTVILPWDCEDDAVQDRVQKGREGVWNPDINEILSCLSQSGFSDVGHSYYKTLMENYTHAWFIKAKVS